jgi:ABC-2 type transport system permease protein
VGRGVAPKWWVIARREWRSAFSSPLAYVLLGLWMLVSGWFYVSLVTVTQSSDLGPLVQNMLVLVLLLAPILTMRLIAEERRAGTEELVLTAPISPAQWVVGKYLGTLAVWTVYVAASFVYPLWTSRLGSVDWGVVAANWIGLWLYGAATLAIGLFASAITDHQLVAAMVSFVIGLLLYAASFFGTVTSGWLGNLVQYVSLVSEFNDFSLGLIGVSQLVYFVSLAAGFLFLAVRAVDLRRWT